MCSMQNMLMIKRKAAASGPSVVAAGSQATSDNKHSIRTLDAKLRLEKVSPACSATGAMLQNMSALASPPSESCSSIVSLEFLYSFQKESGPLHQCSLADVRAGFWKQLSNCNCTLQEALPPVGWNALHDAAALHASTFQHACAGMHAVLQAVTTSHTHVRCLLLAYIRQSWQAQLHIRRDLIVQCRR